MNNRKQQVVKNAHHLFVEKGFQATSIQDIIDYSGISKGTFYNYFSSKNELLIAVFTWLHTTIEQERNQLLVGKSLTDVDVFVKQIDAQMKNHHKHKFFTLLEEVFVSNNPDLKAYIKKKKKKKKEKENKKKGQTKLHNKILSSQINLSLLNI